MQIDLLICGEKIIDSLFPCRVREKIVVKHLDMRSCWIEVDRRDRTDVSLLLPNKAERTFPYAASREELYRKGILRIYRIIHLCRGLDLRRKPGRDVIARASLENDIRVNTAIIKVRTEREYLAGHHLVISFQWYCPFHGIPTAFMVGRHSHECEIREIMSIDIYYSDFFHHRPVCFSLPFTR